MIIDMISIGRITDKREHYLSICLLEGMERLTTKLDCNKLIITI